MERDLAGFGERLQRSDCRKQLHPVVRRPGKTAADFPPAAVKPQQSRVPSGPGIPGARTIGVNDHVLHKLLS